MKVARHFSAGNCSNKRESPIGTIEMTVTRYFNRPYGTPGVFPRPIPAINRRAILTLSLRDGYRER